MSNQLDAINELARRFKDDIQNLPMWDNPLAQGVICLLKVPDVIEQGKNIAKLAT